MNDVRPAALVAPRPPKGIPGLERLTSLFGLDVMFRPDFLGDLVGDDEVSEPPHRGGPSRRLRRRRVRDGKRKTLEVATVKEDFHRVGTCSLDYRERREADHHWCNERNVSWSRRIRCSDMQLTLNLRQQWIPVGVDDLDADLVVTVSFGPVVGQLQDEDDAKRCRKLLPPEDADAAAEDVRLPLADLG